MSWALAYRPQRFNDLIGQKHVVVVLQSILRQHFKGNGLPAGFLFSGTKGTGKTTSARVVAAVLNCQSEFIGDPQYALEPCCACDNCQSVRNSNCLFVHEIDAASSGSVDDIRKIKEIASLSHGGNVRIILLDEAHSLSKAAFEALLKQLEEPQLNVLYIMCTTEAEKFPETILSRLMQFSFKQITPDLITARLQHIVIKEQIPLQDMRVLSAIATKAQGAMRDAIMMLQQLINYKSPLVLQDFLDYYGLIGSEISLKMIDLASKADIVEAKALIQQHFTRSVDVAYFLDNFMLSLTDSFHNRQLTSQQTVELYKVAVEVKSKLKYMSAYVAANYMFAMMFRVFCYQGEATSTATTKQQLEEMFQ